MDGGLSGEGRNPGGIRWREIGVADFASVATFLADSLGYPEKYFLSLLDVLRKHETPAGYPKYGYLLEHAEQIVGTIVLIYAGVETNDGVKIRCQATCWCSDPKYAAYSTLLSRVAMKRKDNEITYINISARHSSLPIIEAEGFVKYSSGQFILAPLFQNPLSWRSARIVPFGEKPNGRYERYEYQLCAKHQEYGCVCVWCEVDGRAYPFVFRKRALKGFLPAAQMIYCTNQDIFNRFSFSFGIYLARMNVFLVSLDANGAIKGLIGKYIDGIEQRYYRGAKPSLGDLAFTQKAMMPDLRMGG
jgi:hypothetical protein